MATCSKCGKDVSAFAVVDAATGKGKCEPCVTSVTGVKQSTAPAPVASVPAPAPAAPAKKPEPKPEPKKKSK